VTADAKYQDEIAQISYLYETTYPGHAVNIYMSKSDDIVPLRGRAHTRNGTVNPWELGQNYLGLATCGSRDGAAPQIDAFVSLGRTPTPAEFATHGQPAAMRSKKVKLLFQVSPLALEYAKFRWETRGRAKRDTRHGWSKIPLSRDFFIPTKDPKSAGADKRPAILIGFHWLEHGGAEKLAFDTVEWALAAGLRVFVISELDGIHRLQTKLPDHPDVTFLRSDRYLSAEDVPRFVRNLVEIENIKVIHIHHCLPIYEALPAIKSSLPDVKVIDSTHIDEHFDGGFVRISGVWSNFVDHHHIISRELAELYIQKFQVRKKLILGRLLERTDQKISLSPFSLTTGQKTLTVAFVGRMTHQKRPALLAAQMRALAKWAVTKDIKITFEIVGEGPHLNPLKALVSRYNLTALTKFYDANTDVRAVLEASDILLLPSSNEGLALVCYEAIEHGAIPITSDVGAQSELIPEALLTSAEPRASIKQVVSIVEMLLCDAAKLEAAKAALTTQYAAINSDPTAYEVLRPLYTAAAMPADTKG
jgi:glycosyltransferase involved in cell wall biosynthesis